MRLDSWLKHLIATMLFVLSAQAHAAATLQVAAAADLAVCIDALNTAFAKTHEGSEIKVSIGSSGNFFAQIKNGAPYDVFLSADLAYPQALIKAGLAESGSLITYAHGQLVLWSTMPDLTLEKGFATFADPRIKRIAIANPDLAPYGRAARSALQHAGIWEAIQPRLVFGDNIAQTAQFVSTGNAQIGIVGAVHVAPPTAAAITGHVWKIPSDWYPLIEQGGVVTTKGRTNPLASQYLAFLQSDVGRAILKKYDFVLPERPR